MSIIEISEQVKQLIADQLALEITHVTDDASFVNDLGADSLDMVELIMAFEEEFGCEIADGEAEHISTVGQAVALVERKLAK